VALLFQSKFHAVLDICVNFFADSAVIVTRDTDFECVAW